MTATVLSDAKAIAVAEAQSQAMNKHAPQPELELVECECCQLVEECTPGYIECIRERHQGRWICGLCAEAVEYEMLRSKRGANAGEALRRHMKLCQQFRSSSPPVNPTEELISAVSHLLKRTRTLLQTTNATEEESFHHSIGERIDEREVGKAT